MRVAGTSSIGNISVGVPPSHVTSYAYVSRHVALSVHVCFGGGE